MIGENRVETFLSSVDNSGKTLFGDLLPTAVGTAGDKAVDNGG